MYFYIYKPPFTLIFSPVIYDESSDSKKETTLDTSDDSAILPKGIFLERLSICSSDKALVMSVSIKPGEIEFTLMFLDDSSLARDFVKPRRPDLDAE